MLESAQKSRPPPHGGLSIAAKKPRLAPARPLNDAGGRSVARVIEGLALAYIVDAGVALLYLVRLAGCLEHPFDHLFGIGCWAVLLALWSMRAYALTQRGSFPVRWGAFLSAVVVFLVALGLLIEISVSTTPRHGENQPGRVFESL